MAKHSKGLKPEVKVREALPKIKEVGKQVLLQCPFCEIPHPIEFGKPALCGTALKVTAVQSIYPIRTVNQHKLVCLKCNKSGGEMVQFNRGYIHLQECSPNTKLMTAPPTFDRFARVVFFMNPTLRKFFEERLGLAKQVQEIDEQGHETGKVLGYFFYKEGVTNG